MCYSCDGKAEFSLLQALGSHDPSEMILIWWFAAQEAFIIISIIFLWKPWCAFFQSSLINRKFTEITFIWNISTLVNIRNGSKHLIKVLKPKCVLVLGPLWGSFSIHFRCWLLYFVSLLFFTIDQFNASLPSKNIYIKKALTKLLNSIWLVIIHDWKGNGKKSCKCLKFSLVKLSVDKSILFIVVTFDMCPL